jgi:hypothetical protein
LPLLRGGPLHATSGVVLSARKRVTFVKLIRTEYDAYNRKFKLLDTSDAVKLRDGETYLFMDFSEDDLKEKQLTEHDESIREEESSVGR